jgi:hypothetical protein
MSRKYYLAYGSNLDVDQMLRRCPEAIQIGSSTIEDYELVFRGNSRRCGVANIEPCGDGVSVPVGIWSITERDEAALDRYEGWPWLYEKQTFYVRVKGKTISAMAYIMTPGHRIAAPTRAYLDTILRGYDDFGFDAAPLLEAADNAERRFHA